VLSDTPARIAVSTYYAVKSRPASARSVRDDEVAAALHCIYADNYSCYGATYGSFAGVIIFLLYLWITNLALLLGAEVDAELERSRQLIAGIEAEEDIQLPPRDDAKIRAAEEKELEDEDKGRALRRSGGDTTDPDEAPGTVNGAEHPDRRDR